MQESQVDHSVILVVDDDNNFQALMQVYLQQRGYTVISADSGFHALEILAEATPDLIISDVMMPDMDGYNLLEQIRLEPKIGWIPTILVSAKSHSHDRVKGLNAGANAYLIKPFDLNELLAHIESSIRTARLMTQNQPKRIKTKLQVTSDVKLTHTELLVAKLMAQGLSNQEISENLNISKRTTESHISHMLRKTDLHNRTELSLWFIESYLNQ
jgi:DNA-binding NarL/FixJ family response regulator